MGFDAEAFAALVPPVWVEAAGLDGGWRDVIAEGSGPCRNDVHTHPEPVLTTPVFWYGGRGPGGDDYTICLWLCPQGITNVQSYIARHEPEGVMVCLALDDYAEYAWAQHWNETERSRDHVHLPA